MTVRVTDMTTGKIELVHIADARSTRVMRRAQAFYHKAKQLQIKGKLLFSYYLKYSWDLENGRIFS